MRSTRELIVIGGGFAAAGELLLDRLERELAGGANPPPIR